MGGPGRNVGPPAGPPLPDGGGGGPAAPAAPPAAGMGTGMGPGMGLGGTGMGAGGPAGWMAPGRGCPRPAGIPRAELARCCCSGGFCCFICTLATVSAGVSVGGGPDSTCNETTSDPCRITMPRVRRTCRASDASPVGGGGIPAASSPASALLFRPARPRAPPSVRHSSASESTMFMCLSYAMNLPTSVLPSPIVTRIRYPTNWPIRPPLAATILDLGPIVPQARALHPKRATSRPLCVGCEVHRCAVCPWQPAPTYSTTPASVHAHPWPHHRPSRPHRRLATPSFSTPPSLPLPPRLPSLSPFRLWVFSWGSFGFVAVLVVVGLRSIRTCCGCGRDRGG